MTITALTSGVASAPFALKSASKYSFSIATTGKSHLKIETTGLGMSTPPSYAVGSTQWSGTSPIPNPPDGTAYGDAAQPTAIPISSGAHTEYIDVLISTTWSGNGTIKVTAT